MTGLLAVSVHFVPVGAQFVLLSGSITHVLMDRRLIALHRLPFGVGSGLIAGREIVLVGPVVMHPLLVALANLLPIFANIAAVFCKVALIAADRLPIAFQAVIEVLDLRVIALRRPSRRASSRRRHGCC
ncbi:MAG: hypothetical protein IPK66_10770 [Rhodospirillales bacterium]|nr:hypothetical protein [Rhodospirillales bacterium]